MRFEAVEGVLGDFISSARLSAELEHCAGTELQVMHSLGAIGSCSLTSKSKSIPLSAWAGENPKSYDGGRSAGPMLQFGTRLFRFRGIETSAASNMGTLKRQNDVRVLAHGTSSEVETLDQIRQGRLGEHPDQCSIRRVADLDLELLTRAAADIRDGRIDSSIITFSPKVFIPLTRVCRDVCGYCTFALGPRIGQPVYMTMGEVLKIARDGVAAGCSEVLFTLGDKPELRYAQARNEVRS